LNLLFGCVHRNYTFPQTHLCALTGKKKQMHVVCLDCGAEARYDFVNMRPLWRPHSPAETQSITDAVEASRVVHIS
jgi:ribosomal protein L32